MMAMILAAGRGERMRPLTDHVPKPLVEVGGKPLIVWHLERLAAAGFREIVINVSHLGAQIEQALGSGRAWGHSIKFSREPEPLDTAGALAFARAQLGEQPFLLANGDVYCEYPLARLRALGLGKSLAHLVLVPNPAFRTDGDFSLEDGCVGNRAAPRYTYAGLAVISPRLVSAVDAGAKAGLAPLLRSNAEAGRVSGELYAGLWADVGTSERRAALDARLRAARAETRTTR
ncbi:MAG: nucleotidyltransferase family protein [Betaproteobacteria bacterium]|nr:nucleotidyltransferase family protein [Betaproteobacteria bacterium]